MFPAPSRMERASLLWKTAIPGNKTLRSRWWEKARAEGEKYFLPCRISFFGLAVFVLKWRQSARSGPLPVLHLIQ